ncbi:MAG: inositol phosphorylceramide synthase [Myxococcales bacterium]|nr:inositol phosphorylceramide synthase [Myxococcales bacterium]
MSAASQSLPSGFAARIRALWGPWWPVPLLVFPAYSAIMLAIGDLRPEHVGLTLVVWILAVIGPRSKRFLVDISPYFVVALGYDLVRYARPVFVSADRVLGCQLRQAEVSLFGFGSGHTPGDWLQGHHLPALDVFFAVPYTIFIYVAFIYAAYLYFVDRQRMRRFLWAFAIANYISFTLWMIVPAAPPWYLREAGCHIDMSAVPSAAGLLRVDSLLGIDYFHTFYSRAASVYGAMPSMHCAYPVLGLFSAWKSTTWKTRPLHLFYALWMFCAAIYLDHHWILDALAGWTVAGIAVFLAGRLTARFAATEEDTAETEVSEQLEVRHEHA